MPPEGQPIDGGGGGQIAPDGGGHGVSTLTPYERSEWPVSVGLTVGRLVRSAELATRQICRSA